MQLVVLHYMWGLSTVKIGNGMTVTSLGLVSIKGNGRSHRSFSKKSVMEHMDIAGILWKPRYPERYEHIGSLSFDVEDTCCKLSYIYIVQCKRKTSKLLFNIANGIYPSLEVLMNTTYDCSSCIKIVFASQQEGVKKE